MKTNLCSLIVISPESPEIWKIQITRKAVVILAVAFFVSFCVSVAFTQSVNNQSFNLDEVDYKQLQAENRAMRIENRNAEIRTRKVDVTLSQLEERSNRLTALIDAD
jgi:hypothetical protein